MARYPVAGRVKTRLAAALGADAACALYRAFVLDLAERLGTLPYPVTWRFTPARAPFAALLPGARCRPQRGRDLGERMAAAIGDELAAAPGPVLTIGADAPHIPAAALAEATHALSGGADVVLGPAGDGGYYLIGVRVPAPTLFADIAWGTGSVLETTRARAAAAGMRVHLLPPGFDVDEVKDLTPLREVLARGEVRLPRTTSVLTDLEARY